MRLSNKKYWSEIILSIENKFDEKTLCANVVYSTNPLIS